MTIRPFRALALCIAVLFASVPAHQASAVNIEVLVNGVPITTYDISQRVALQQVSGQTASRSTATQQLIDEALQVGAAAARGIVVSEAQVDAAFASIAQQVGLGISQFNQALRESGVEPATLKAQIRAQIYWSQLLQVRLQTNPAVRQEDVTAQLLAQGGANEMVYEYLMQQIIFVVPQGAGNVSQRRSEAETFRQRFTGCENTLQQSLALRDVTVREIGRDMSQLTPAQAETVRDMTSTGVTRPVTTDRGVEIIAICSVRQVQANEQARTQIQNELLIDLGNEIGQEYLAELRADAVIIRY